MAILAGIDEAGYGPTLGPLVVTGVSFHVPDDQLSACLWTTLRASCAATTARSGPRLVIADSKKLYSSRGGLAPLERAALVMLAVAGHRPKSRRCLLEVVSPGTQQELDQYPWYAQGDVALPVCRDLGDIPTKANAVRTDCAAHDVQLSGVLSEVLPAGRFNRLARSTRNKAVVLLGLVMRVADRILRAAPRERVRLCIDRLGGKQHYREALATALPEYELQILEESSTRSRYRLVRAQVVRDIEFITSGEKHSFAIALASVFSKYIRELHMHMFNRYWTTHQRALKPTAGYYTDARRWLEDAASTIDRLNVDRNMLVRLR